MKCQVRREAREGGKREVRGGRRALDVVHRYICRRRGITSCMEMISITREESCLCQIVQLLVHGQDSLPFTLTWVMSP